MIPPVFMYYLYGVIVIGAIVGAASIIFVYNILFPPSQALLSQNQSIRSLDEGRVYVELRALRQDEKGYFIPGYGRILQTWENTDVDPLRQMPEVRRWKGKVALICHDKKEVADDVRKYVIEHIVPL
jgi:hypothetical protein